MDLVNDNLTTVALGAGLLYLAYHVGLRRKSKGLEDFPSAPKIPLLGAIPYLSDFNAQSLEWSKTLGPAYTLKLGFAEEMLIVTTSASVDKLLEHDVSLPLRPRLPFFKDELHLHDEWLPLQDTTAHVTAQRKALGAGVRQTYDFSPESGIERSSQALLKALKERNGRPAQNREWIDLFQEVIAVLGISLSYGLKWNVDDIKKSPAASDLVHAVTETLGVLDMTTDPTFVFPFLVRLLPWRTAKWRKRAAEIRAKAYNGRQYLYNSALQEVENGGIESLEPSTLRSILANDDSSSSLDDNDRQMSIASAFAGSGELFSIASYACSKVGSSDAMLTLTPVDTSSHMLSVIVACLAAYPEWQKVIRDETRVHWQNSSPPPKDVIDKVKYAKAFVRETMRLYPIISGYLRMPDKPLHLDGKYIPEKTIILVASHCVNRDPVIYGPDSTEFRPSRWIEDAPKFHVYGHTSFGMGRRSCPGSALAELVLSLSVCRIIWEFDVGFAEKGPMGGAALTTEFDGVLEIQGHRPLAFRPLQ